MKNTPIERNVIDETIITSLLNAINKIYESYPVSKNRPITFFIQLIKVFLYTVVVITVVSVLVNKSPEHLIVGLSAFAAVLLLIFKDSILGFVAGIQLTSNNMILQLIKCHLFFSPNDFDVLMVTFPPRPVNTATEERPFVI